MDRYEQIKKVKRIVVKVGSAVLTHQDYQLHVTRIRHLVTQLSALHAKGYEIVLVSSGAILVGASALGYERRPQKLALKQASAAVGQGRLIHIYQKMFDQKKIVTAQVLLTRSDLENRSRYVNAQNTLHELLAMKVIPIVNENDTVAVDEIEFGDNDTLAALCTNLIRADLLIILSDIEGLLTGDPKTKGTSCERIPVVTKIDRDIEMIADGTRAYQGVGGIKTKLNAAKIVVLSGEMMVLADGKSKNILTRILDGEMIGTIFYPSGKKMKHKKRWLAFSGAVQGSIVVDEGAVRALYHAEGRSLLPSGIVDVKKEFQKGDVVEIQAHNGKVVGRGRVNYSGHEIRLIRGKKTKEIHRLLGDVAREEVIHRDEMVIF